MIPRHQILAVCLACLAGSVAVKGEREDDWGTLDNWVRTNTKSQNQDHNTIDIDNNPQDPYYSSGDRQHDGVDDYSGMYDSEDDDEVEGSAVPEKPSRKPGSRNKPGNKEQELEITNTKEPEPTDEGISIEKNKDNQDIKNHINNMPDTDIDIQTISPNEGLGNNEIGSPMSSKGQNHVDRAIMSQPGILAGIIGGAVVGLLCAVLLVMFIVYRMRKKDEGSYALDEPKRSPAHHQYSRASTKEFYA